MATEPPYGDGYPQIPEGGWQSTTYFELGWISGLYKVANKTLNSIYGAYEEFYINADDPLNFDHLDSDTFTSASVGPIIYLSIWTVILVVFAIAGLCWCLCQKCCCCCRTNFKNGRNIDELQDSDPTYQLRPYYSERNSKKHGGMNVTAIVISVVMAVWLILFLIMILHTFASNYKTKDAIDQIQPDLENAIDDVNKYIDLTIDQLDHSFSIGSGRMSDKIMEIVDDCPVSDPSCDFIRTEVRTALQNTKVAIADSSSVLKKSLGEVQDAMRTGKDELDGDFEDVINKVNSALHWFFMLFNLLYCAIFLLVLVGTVLAAFARGGGLKTAGFLIVRGAIVLMLVVGLFVIIQLMGFFVFGGIVSEIICPAVKELEVEPVTKLLRNFTYVSLKQEDNGGEYEVPNVGEILRSCKKDESAYNAFNLETAYNIDNIEKILNNFDFPDPPGYEGIAGRIKTEVEGYVKYVVDSTKEEMGRCLPVYNAINSTLSLFCDKITAPVTGYWFILQFVLPTFVFIIITALFLERFA